MLKKYFMNFRVIWFLHWINYNRVKQQLAEKMLFNINKLCFQKFSNIQKLLNGERGKHKEEEVTETKAWLYKYIREEWFYCPLDNLHTTAKYLENKEKLYNFLIFDCMHVIFRNISNNKIIRLPVQKYRIFVRQRPNRKYFYIREF